MSTEQTLNYAPPPVWHRRRRLRWIAAVVCVLVLTYAGVHWGPLAWRRIRLAYWQYQCLRYTTPTQVVYEQDPALVPLLLQSKKGYLAYRTSSSTDAGYTPSCFSGFADASGVLFPAEPVVFLHERVSPNGTSKLVIVQCDPGWMPQLTMANYFDKWALDPSTLMTTPAGWSAPMMAMKMGPMRPPQPGDPYIRFFAGQPDPADASHFTIDYQLNDQSGTIDGWLRDSGVIDLRVRKPETSTTQIKSPKVK